MKLVNGKRSQLLEYLMIIAGTGLMALAINSVFDASGMVTGGFSGIAIILYHLFGLPVGAGTIILNVPVAIFCYKFLGKEF